MSAESSTTVLPLPAWRLGAIASIGLCLLTVGASDTPGRRMQDRGGWISLFNGKDLAGWTPKITGYPAGENYADTFRVEDGVLKVSYDKYPKFDGKFGHLFSKHEVLALPAADRVPVRGRPVPRRARLGRPQQRRDDPLPVAREHAEGPGLPRLDRGPVPRRRRQGGAPDRQRLHAGHARRDGRQAHHAALHRTRESKTYHGDQWVTVEVEVHGNGTIKHVVNGETVLEYEKPQLDEQRPRRPEADRGRGRRAPRGLHRPPGREPPGRVPQGGDPPP